MRARLARALPWAALALGTSLLAVQVSAPGARDRAAAWVDGRPIPQARFDALADALADAAGAAHGDRTRARAQALRLLIDEELLLQRAERMDLLYRDRRLRTIAVQSALDRVAHGGARAAPRPVDESAWRALERRVDDVLQDRLAHADIRVAPDLQDAWERARRAPRAAVRRVAEHEETR